MNSSTREIYRRKIQEIANDYEARGYRVLIEPSRKELPPFLADFHPDIIAYGPQDSVVIEVKVGTRTAASEHYRELAETIRQHPGWRFSLVVVDPRSDEVAPATQPLLDREKIVNHLKEAEELFKLGLKEAAFILLWLSVEALLRHIASREGLPLERIPSSALLKELYSLGLLSHDGLDIALRAFSVRNALVHGFEAQELDPIFGELTLLSQELLVEFDQSGNSTA
jgi:uncharacterized protein YutE (UPF0331/DUF86 family)